jgi:hypothetical protein
LFQRNIYQQEKDSSDQKENKKRTLRDLLRAKFQDKLSDEFQRKSKSFMDYISFCEKMIDFHKKQFTKTLESEVTIDNVPEHIQKLLEQGL